jgi:small subunit ribosomal protein S6
MFILDASLAEDAQERALTHIREIVTGADGEVESLNLIGRRRLAYPIDRHTEGIYGLLYFRGAQAVDELKREMRLSSDIIRSMVFVANEDAIWPLGEPPRPVERAAAEGEGGAEAMPAAAEAEALAEEAIEEEAAEAEAGEVAAEEAAEVAEDAESDDDS